MAFGATFDVAAPLEVYDQLLPEVQTAIGGPLADGCLVHIVTPTDSGYRVIEVWESEQHWRRFRTEILTPLLQRLTGEESPDQPPPQQFPVHAVRIAQVK